MRGPPAFVHFRSSAAKSRGTSKRRGTTPFPILGVSAAALRHTRAGFVGLTLAVLFGQGLTLLIELKIHGHESPDVVEEFLATLDSIGSTEKHIYHSLNAGVVKELQARRPELTVGRTVAISIGDVTRIAGDFLVVEQTFFTEELAQYARKENKQVFVWTVNDEDAIREYLRMPVDGIVTDKPDVAVRERARIENERGSAAHLRDNLHDFTVF